MWGQYSLKIRLGNRGRIWAWYHWRMRSALLMVGIGALVIAVGGYFASVESVHAPTVGEEASTSLLLMASTSLSN